MKSIKSAICYLLFFYSSPIVIHDTALQYFNEKMYFCQKKYQYRRSQLLLKQQHLQLPEGQMSIVD